MITPEPLPPSQLFNLRDFIYALANLMIGIILMKQCTYIESKDNIQTFIGWVQRTEFSSVDALKSYATNPIPEAKTSGSIVFTDFEISNKLKKTSVHKL